MSFPIPIPIQALQWGVYLGGAPVLLADSIVAVEYKKEWAISDYPIERGQFETYNKVRTPFEARVVMTRSGFGLRSLFIANIEAIAESLLLYDIVTPDCVFLNCNVNHFDYSRTATNGANLLTVSLWFQEVRIEAASFFTATGSPSGQAQVNGGVMQPSGYLGSMPRIL